MICEHIFAAADGDYNDDDIDDDIVTSDYSPHPLKENLASPNPVLMTTNLEHALDFSMVSGDIVEENLPMFAGTLLDSDDDTVIFTEHVDIHTGAASYPTPISMPGSTHALFLL